MIILVSRTCYYATFITVNIFLVDHANFFSQIVLSRIFQLLNEFAPFRYRFDAHSRILIPIRSSGRSNIRVKSKYENVIEISESREHCIILPRPLELMVVTTFTRFSDNDYLLN